MLYLLKFNFFWNLSIKNERSQQKTTFLGLLFLPSLEEKTVGSGH